MGDHPPAPVEGMTASTEIFEGARTEAGAADEPVAGGGSDRGRSPVHAVTWLVWAIAGATCTHLAPNPLYVLVVLGIAWVVVQTHNSGGALARAFPVLVLLGAAMGLIKVLLTLLTTHGLGAALVTLPEATLPQLLGGFTIGGTIEDIVLWRSLAEAFAIVGILGVFGAFNAIVSHDELVRSLPRALHDPGVVLTVGLAFVPATITSVRMVQESDRARTGGEVVRRGRLVRLMVPVLEQGMERAVLLSESMDARGYGRDAATAADRVAASLAFGGVLAIGGAVIALVGRSSGLAAVLAAAGAVLLAIAIITSSGASTRSRYRPRSLHAIDAVVMATSLLAAGGVLALAVSGEPTLRWPGDSLTVPGVDPRVLLAVAFLIVPALLPHARSDPR